MTHESFAALLALIGVVIIVSSLLSGAVERTGLPLVAIFLLVGEALGPSGLGVVSLTLESPALRVIATLALLLVLFSDAIGVDIKEVRQQRRLAALILGADVAPPDLDAIGQGAERRLRLHRRGHSRMLRNGASIRSSPEGTIPPEPVMSTASRFSNQ